MLFSELRKRGGSWDVVYLFTVSALNQQINNVPGYAHDLWKEYASNGAGIVLEYEAEEGSSIGLAGRVKYTDEPVLLDLLKIDELKCYEIFTTKTTKWRVEEEYRMVERLIFPMAGNNFSYFDVKIRSVRLGINLNKIFRKEIMDLCQHMDVAIY